MEPLDAHRSAGDHLLRTSAAVSDAAWPSSSGCDGWTLADLVAHLVGGSWMTVVLLDGASADDAAAVATCPPGGVQPAALAAAIAAERTALAIPDLHDRRVRHPVLEMTGVQLLETRLVELVVHGWDLARSVGAASAIDAEAAEVAWSAFAPLADVTGSLGMFGPGSSGALGSTATAVERLLDATGRRP